MNLPLWINITLIFLILGCTLGDCGLVDSATYKISFAGAAERQCQGSYLSYDSTGKTDRAFLSKPSGMPGLWQVKTQGTRKITLKAVSIPGCCPPKLGYSSRCSSTDVKLNGAVDLNTLWTLVPVNNGTLDTYTVIPDQLSNCKSVSYLLGVNPSGGASPCGRSVSFVKNKTTAKMVWKFTRVKASALPPPTQSAPSPPAVIEKTVVASVTLITLNQTCSSLSQAELQKMTQDLCARQVNYTLSQGWPRKQTICEGSARCPSPQARQTGSTSEHSTELSLIYIPGQSQTADGVANSVAQALNQPQTFYANSLPAGTGVSSSQSTVIPPTTSGGQPSPTISPIPSPSPPESPIPTSSPTTESPNLSPTFNTVSPIPDNVFPNNPNYNPLPTPVPTPGGGATPLPSPPPPPAVKYAYIANDGSPVANTITRCTLDVLGGFTQCVITTPTGGFNLSTPRGIAISGNNAYIVTSGNNGVTKCTMSAGAFVSCAVATPSTGGFNMASPSNIAISGGYAYVTNSATAVFPSANTVTKCALDGTGGFTNCIVNTPNTGSFRLYGPKGISIANNIAYITNTDSLAGPTGVSVTQCLMNGANFESCAVSSATSPAVLSNPSSIAIVGDYAFITNTGNSAITRCTLDSTTKLITACAYGMAGSPPPFAMVSPFATAFLNGYSYSTNIPADVVTKCSYDSSGVFSSCALLTVSTGSINIKTPYGIAIA